MTALNITDFSKYYPLALRTARNDKITMEYQALHASMGLVTEIGELVDNLKRQVFYGTPENVVNFKEEIGDVLWYIALGYFSSEETDLEFPVAGWPLSLNLLSRSNEPRDIVSILGELTKLAAIPAAYIMRLDPDSQEYRDTYFLEDLRRIYVKLVHICELKGFSITECMEANIRKLMKRYPDGFSEFNAVNRDTVKELEHIAA